jgi:hypothetical protein
MADLELRCKRFFKERKERSLHIKKNYFINVQGGYKLSEDYNATTHG